jgi:selenocysteine-specific elongation factor
LGDKKKLKNFEIMTEPTSTSTTTKGNIPKCGNDSCVCGKQCECPYGGCSCSVVEEEDNNNNNKQILTTEEKSTSTTTTTDLVNVNIGVLGHVNSGKTSLVRALSTTLSTAALDKHPQAKERGMTIDLGFSSFTTQAPAPGTNGFPPGITKVQYTLVDCPGHASLIRTIINGAQIIDRMLLVIDVTKGIQAQTAECLVIGEILAQDMIIVLNKIDLIPDNERPTKLPLVEQTIRAALQHTRFANAPMVTIAAHVGGDVIVNTPSNPNLAPLTSQNLIELVRLIRTTTIYPQRGGINDPFYFSIDHAFPIKGSGQIITGTVLSGKTSINQEIEIPQLGVTKKIKSIQRFKQPVTSIEQGDRAAISVTNLDSSKLERGVACSPGTVPSSSIVLALIRKVKYFDRPCLSGSKVHITIGPATVLATCTFFGGKELKPIAKELFGKSIPNDCGKYLGQNTIASNKTITTTTTNTTNVVGEYEFDEGLQSGGKQAGGPVLQWVLLECEEPVLCPRVGQILGSRLDTDVTSGICRIAFYGSLAKTFTSKESLKEVFRVFKRKERIGTVDRIEGGEGTSGKANSIPPGTLIDSLIGKGLFKKDSDINAFVGLKVVMLVSKSLVEQQQQQQQQDKSTLTITTTTSSSSSPLPAIATNNLIDEAIGVIESSFGKTGKFRVVFRSGKGTIARAGDKIALRFRKYMWETDSSGKKTLAQVI